MNYGKGINFYVIGKVRIGVYIRQWMYHKLFRAFDRPRTVKHRFVVWITPLKPVRAGDKSNMPIVK
jgi:hypothetical protein